MNARRTLSIALWVPGILLPGALLAALAFLDVQSIGAPGTIFLALPLALAGFWSSRTSAVGFLVLLLLDLTQQWWPHMHMLANMYGAAPTWILLISTVLSVVIAFLLPGGGLGRYSRREAAST